MTYTDVLVATDGGDPALAAIEEALTVATAFDATLHAVYVLQTGETPPWFEDPAEEPGVDTRAGQALDAVESKAAERDFEPEVVTAVLEGETAPAIVEYARDRDVDLVVMGTHGRTGIDRLVVGSVAESVVRESPAPVMTVRPD